MKEKRVNYYIFRIDYSKQKYFKENLEKGILRQGWGVENLSLLDENGEIRNQEEWVNACPESWRTTDEARRYLRNKNSNLRKMLEMKEGDIILIPKFPEWNMFSLYRVTGKYYFNLEETAVDYGHCIPVKIATTYPYEIDKCFTYNGNDETKKIHSKLRGYQTSINSVYNEEIIKAIESLLQIKSIKEVSPITEILRNIFCVAASRGKNQIIFVDSDEAKLSEKTLSTPVNMNMKFENMEISDMFEFKFKEDVEQCFETIRIKKIESEDNSIIRIKNSDGLIDLSPCIGIFQEAAYFDGYSIDESIEFHIAIDKDKSFLYTDDVKNSSLEEKILFVTSLETKQNRYRNQVAVPFISDTEENAICERLATRLSKNEDVQSACALYFSNKRNGDLLFTAFGMVDAVKDDVIYELKFVSELTHEHVLQCASYVVAMGKKKGILWNTRDNTLYEITVPNKSHFLDTVTNAITKGVIKKYNKPSDKNIQLNELGIKLSKLAKKEG